MTRIIQSTTEWMAATYSDTVHKGDMDYSLLRKGWWLYICGTVTWGDKDFTTQSTKERMAAVHMWHRHVG